MASVDSNVFYADAVLFDMDGTLTDSIAAVEAAWSKVAKDIGQDPEYVIAATHGKRAVDNLSQFKPSLSSFEIEAEVERFENTILYYADAFHTQGSGLPPASGDIYQDSGIHSYPPPAWSIPSSSDSTPGLTPGSTTPSSRHSSVSARRFSTVGRRPSFGSRLLNMLSTAARMRINAENDDGVADEEEGFVRADANDEFEAKKIAHDIREAWKTEAASVDRSVRILPGVRRMIDSLPEGRYAVATSGAKTYGKFSYSSSPVKALIDRVAYGCMKRVGIAPPAVTITADDKRLKAGKPAPDPFLLAAECLGYDAKRCVVFEDSPSGIRAGVASGATVIAVCTSHDREKIQDCGAHYLVENMEKVQCVVEPDGRLKFTVEPLGE